MMPQIKTIALGGVNCYLVSTGGEFILIDSGFPFNRDDLTKRLEAEGCLPGKLKLILVTHGDWDHTGNCAYLRDHYKAPIAMHKADSGGRQPVKRKMKPLSVMLVSLPKIMRLLPKMQSHPLEYFEPDLFLEEGQSLADYGLNATIVHVPGHTKGSIAILTEAGDLFCGDIMHDSYVHKGRPVFAQIIEDENELHQSIEKLKQLKIKTVFPGHGKPFLWENLINREPQKDFPKFECISAVSAMASAFGIWCGISGLEHGFFEVLQGNVVPVTHMISGTPMIYAIGDANRFWPYGFEYAFTLIPNFLITGLLAMMVGLLVVIWAAGFIQKKYGWLVFILLSILQYVVGGGAAQVGPAILVGLVASSIDRPLQVWRNFLPEKLRQVLAKPWLWLLITFVVVLCQSTITAIFGFFFWVKDPDQISNIQWKILYVLMGLLCLVMISALAHDSLRGRLPMRE